jgi:hypothetical protein
LKTPFLARGRAEPVYGLASLFIILAPSLTRIISSKVLSCGVDQDPPIMEVSVSDEGYVRMKVMGPFGLGVKTDKFLFELAKMVFESRAMCS